MGFSSSVLLSVLASTTLALSFNRDAGEFIKRETNDELILDKRSFVNSITSTPALFDKFIYFIFLDHGFHGALINSVTDIFTGHPGKSSATLMKGISGTQFAQSLFSELHGSQGDEFLGSIAPVYNCGCEAGTPPPSTGGHSSSGGSDGMDMGGSEYTTDQCMPGGEGSHGGNVGGSFVATIFLGIVTGSIVKDTFEAIQHDVCLISHMFRDIAVGNLMNVGDLSGMMTKSDMTPSLLNHLKGSNGLYKNDVDTWVQSQGPAMVEKMKSMSGM
ncbi:uncharacterized protein KQ657_000755 [Scheffersomyces spartinae]|uniref:Uncharacterized protein n=1 Tax=Scheffersomyces spartinae TaxID=45513 RepID=A0A9P7V8V3_9ASCO|nr:uncharacterized protein KQ657_000755 [Scheffersomyces spartinae]KAG7193339.1 hypothetical protein KQ657_000755 [Scheffersomyces spartinae]